MVVFLNRYAAGLMLRAVRRAAWDETTDDFEPTITVVVPLYNEGAGVAATLTSVLASDYPAAKLRVECIDDASTDDSHAHAAAVARGDARLTVWRNATNLGKRRAIIEAVRRSTSEIIVSVDSDVLVDPGALRQLVRRFTSPRIAAVGGWVDVRNKHDTWLTRMQTVQYWYAYFVMRNIERAFKQVLCTSGCLSAYRRSALLALEPVLAGRALLGVPVKHGEDRFLCRQLVKAGYLTTLTLEARCQTFVPRTLGPYLSQQLRWRRSNVVDYLGGLGHVWRLHPLIAINYFAQLVVLVGYPVAVARLLATGHFVPAVLIHAQTLALFGLYYRFRVRGRPPGERVGALSFMAYAVVMPVTYALLAPLAMWTLDSASWETRVRAGEGARQEA